MVDSLRSPTRTTMRGSSSPSLTSARPKPSRVFFISTFSGSWIATVMIVSAAEQALGPLGVARAELAQSGFGLVHLGRLAVPAIVVGHVGDPLAHHGVGENHARLTLMAAGGGEGAQDVVHVVAV